MNEQKWLAEYLDRYHRSIFDIAVHDDLIRLAHTMKAASSAGRNAIFAGNGGSAAIASHCAVDFSKNAGIRASSFCDASLITSLANDFGYEHWIEHAIRLYSNPGDTVVLISSSGQSPNVVHAARYARAVGLRLVTFTGFDPANPLRTLGDVNFWVDSRAYNVVEVTHQLWLLAVCDLLIGQAEYRVDVGLTRTGLGASLSLTGV